MRNKIIISLILLVSFLLPFYIFTYLSDVWCQHNGDYQEGIQAEQGLYQ